MLYSLSDSLQNQLWKKPVANTHASLQILCSDSVDLRGTSYRFTHAEDTSASSSKPVAHSQCKATLRLTRRSKNTTKPAGALMSKGSACAAQQRAHSTGRTWF